MKLGFSALRWAAALRCPIKVTEVGLETQKEKPGLTSSRTGTGYHCQVSFKPDFTQLPARGKRARKSWCTQDRMPQSRAMVQGRHPHTGSLKCLAHCLKASQLPKPLSILGIGPKEQGFNIPMPCLPRLHNLRALAANLLSSPGHVRPTTKVDDQIASQPGTMHPQKQSKYLTLSW